MNLSTIGGYQTTQVPVWARWLAQDADGHWWVYEHEPNQGARGWYENEVGRCALFNKDAPPENWLDSLSKLPGHG